MSRNSKFSDLSVFFNFPKPKKIWQEELNRFSLSVGLLFLSLLASASLVAAEDTISYRLSRVAGTDVGFGRIQGNFRLTANAPEDVISMEVLFNNEVVHEVENNSISWRFNTDDYETGEINITIRGWTAADNLYEVSLERHFISGDITIWIIIGVVIVLAVYGGMKLRGNKKEKGGKKEPASSANIKIDCISVHRYPNHLFFR